MFDLVNNLGLKFEIYIWFCINWYYFVRIFISVKTELTCYQTEPIINCSSIFLKKLDNFDHICFRFV